MPPDTRVPGPASSADDWETWWRDYVMKELERLNNNLEMLKYNSGLDIKELQVKFALWGAIAGGLTGTGTALLILLINKFMFK